MQLFFCTRHSLQLLKKAFLPRCNLTPSSIARYIANLFSKASPLGGKMKPAHGFTEACGGFLCLGSNPGLTSNNYLLTLSKFFTDTRKQPWVLPNRDRHLGFLSSHKINNIHFGTLSLPKEHKRSTSFDIGFPRVYINRKFFGTVVPLETHYDRLTKKLQVITSS